MRTKQASSSNWIGEPRLSSHPRLRFFDMAPHQMQETQKPQIHIHTITQTSVSCKTSPPQGSISSRPHETHSRLHHRSTSALQIPANAPQILSRATSRGLGRNPDSRCADPEVRERTRAGPEEGPGSPAPAEPGTVILRPAKLRVSLPFFSFTLLIPRLGHGQSGAGSRQGPALLKSIPTSHGILPSTLVNGGIDFKELGINFKP